MTNAKTTMKLKRRRIKEHKDLCGKLFRENSREEEKQNPLFKFKDYKDGTNNLKTLSISTFKPNNTRIIVVILL